MHLSTWSKMNDSLLHRITFVVDFRFFDPGNSDITVLAVVCWNEIRAFEIDW